MSVRHHDVPTVRDTRDPLRRFLRRFTSDRGAVIVELAVVLPIFMLLVSAMFDLGLSFHSSRKVASTVRDAARIGAAADTDRLADYDVLTHVKAVYDGSDDMLQWVTIHRASPGSDGAVPVGCGNGEAGVVNLCNTYSIADIEAMTPATFDHPSCVADPDENWCPTERQDAYNAGDFLAVTVWVDHDALLGLWYDENNFERTSVFQLNDDTPPSNIPLATGACFATLYQDFSQNGLARGFGLGDQNLVGDMDNEASSVTVEGDGCVALVTNSWDGLGECRVYLEGDSDMGDFDDQASYIWVGIPPTPPCNPDEEFACEATFHSDINFAGDEVTYRDGGFNLVAPMDNTVSSMTLTGESDCVVFVTDLPNGEGNCRTLTADEDNFQDISFDEVTSYIWVGQPPVPTCDPCISPSSVPDNVVQSGDAGYSPATSTFTITPDVTTQSGTVMSTVRIDLRRNFNIEFDVNLGTKNLAGADGMAFVFHDDPDGAATVGVTGGGLGIGGIENSVAIEFDTYDNSYVPGGDDVANDHTGIYDPEVLLDGTHYGAVNRLTAAVTDLGNVEDGVWRPVVINWDATNELLTYEFDNAPIATLAIDLITDHMGSDFAHFGITGSTGGASNLQELRFTEFNAVTEGGEGTCEPEVTGNPPPTIDPIPDRTDEVGDPVSIVATASDPDGEPLTFTGDGLPPGVAIDPDGNITGNPTTPGIYEVTITVTDPAGGADSTTFTWTVTQTNCDDVPGTIASWMHVTNAAGANAFTVTGDQDGRVIEFPIDDVATDTEWWDGGGTGVDAGYVDGQGAAERIGPGLTLIGYGNLDGTVGSANLAGVDQDTLEEAYYAGDYVEYEFSTVSSVATTFVRNLAFLDVPGVAWRANYTRSVLISDDGFATASALLEDAAATVGSDGVTDEFPLTNYGYELEASTTYTVRVYLYDSSTNDEAVLDDFGLAVRSGADCTGTPPGSVDFDVPDDTDGDGIPDDDDIDDDNDGILDVDECSALSHLSILHLFDPALPLDSGDDHRLYKQLDSIGSTYVDVGEDGGDVFAATNVSDAHNSLAYDAGEYWVLANDGDSLLYTNDIIAGTFIDLGDPQVGVGVDNIAVDDGVFWHFFNTGSTIELWRSTNPVLNGWTKFGDTSLAPGQADGLAVHDGTFYALEIVDAAAGDHVSRSTTNALTVGTWTNDNEPSFGTSVGNYAIGIEDPYVSCDPDGDGVPNPLDLDSDDDGISDLVEGGLDPAVFDLNGDGEIDDVDNADPGLDNDANDNGLSDAVEAIYGDETGVTLVHSDEAACVNELLQADGTFESLAGVATSEAPNSNVTGGGWFNGVGSADSWLSPMPTTGSGYTGGFADGTPSSPDGGVFGGLYHSANSYQESFYSDIAGLVVGGTYSVGFWAVNAGVDGNTPLGDVSPIIVDFGADQVVTDELPYLGESNQVWVWQYHVFTATAETQRLEFTIDPGSDGAGFYQLMGIDGVRIAHLGVDGCDEVPDYIDLDSDGDGIPDTIEGQTTPGYASEVGPDDDGDGVDNTWDSYDGHGGNFPNGGVPIDTDTDGIYDFRDTDADNDAVSDKNESGLSLSEADTNEDGIDDGVNASYVNTDGDVDDPANDLSNAPGTDTSEVAYREVNDTDGDGVADGIDIDDDNDGILDTVESGIAMIGSLSAWGDNGTGRLGDGTTTDRSSPVGVDTDYEWVSIAGGSNYSCAVNDTGELWCWGSNSSGQLGNGTTSAENSGPVRIGGDADWVDVSAGGYRTTCATKADGTAWCWGYNLYHTVTNTTTANQTSPVQIGSDADWDHVAVGDNHVCGVKVDGTAWCWGYNGYGQVGNGTTATRQSTPVQVGSDSTWQQIAAGQDHTCGINAGELYCWGRNGSGRLGDGTTTQRTTPTQVGSDANWRQVEPGDSHSCAVRIDGTAWCWGNGNDGRLGNGSSSTSQSPVQVGSETTWSHVTASVSHTCAVQSNGTAWCWGDNDDGPLGDGTTTTRTTPVQVVSGTDWVAIASSGNHMLAIAADPSVAPELDTDGDGVANRVDLDSDNDGISDIYESGQDAASIDANSDGEIDDMDGVLNDANGNGLSDAVEAINGEQMGHTPDDFDRDGVAQMFDLDSDNDGIPDVVESQDTASYVAFSGADDDTDGVDNVWDSAAGFGGSFITPTNTDGLADGPDFLDTDSDNDSPAGAEAGYVQPGATIANWDFASGVEGWEMREATNTSTWVTPDWSAGALHHIDTINTGGHAYFRTDLDGNSDLSSLYGGTVEFRYYSTHAIDNPQDVIIFRGANGASLIYDGSAATTAATWHDISIDVTVGQFRLNAADFATEQEIRDVLQSVDYLEVSGEYSTNSTDQAYVDDVTLISAPSLVGGANSLLDQVESGLALSGQDLNGDGIDDLVSASYSDPDGQVNDPQTDLANAPGTDTSEVAYREVIDTDGDGIADAVDLDDDNDGITDAVECGGGGSLAGFLSSSAAAYAAASVDEWVSITAAEYQAMRSGVAGTTVFGTAEGNEKTGTFANFGGSNMYTYGQNTNPAPANVYVYAFSRAGANPISGGNDLVRLSTATNGTGFNQYGSVLPDGTIESNQEFWVLKDPSTQQSQAVYLGLSTDHGNPIYYAATGTSGRYSAGSTSTVSTAAYGWSLQGLAAESLGGGQVLDCGVDTDSDGVDDSLDLDSDNDGISDLVESGQDDTVVDTNGDGELDDMDNADPALNNDADDDGLSDAVEAINGDDTGYTPPDTDDDGLTDQLDLDADNDSIPDAVEWQPSQTFVEPVTGDADGDGHLDVWDSVNGFGGDFPTPQNTDGLADGADWIDTDADEDAFDDVDESGFTLALSDADGDGIDDAVNASYTSASGDVSDPLDDLYNSPGTDFSEVAYREVTDTDGDGIADGYDLDDDNDGITDAIECGGGSGYASFLSTSAAAYAAAGDLEWVSITGAEYEALAAGVSSTTRFGTPAGSEQTGALGNFGGGTQYTFGQYLNPSPSNVYVYAFKRGSAQPISGGNDVVRLSTNTNGSGFNQYGSFLPDGSVDSNEEFFIIKTPSLQTQGVYLGLTTNENTNIYYNANSSSGRYSTGSTTSVVTAANGWSMQGLATTEDVGGAAGVDCTLDTDGDGIVDSLDLDSDNDGISDIVESGQDGTVVDTNRDGELDDMDNADPALNNDADNDGLSDTAETANGADTGYSPPDTDADTIVNTIDLDSDNDLIPDAIENQSTQFYVPASDSNAAGIEDDDADGDGINNAWDAGSGHGGAFIRIEPIDTDADGTFDYLDDNSDSDDFPDVDESGNTASGADANNDGADDVVNTSYSDPDGDINNPQVDLPNELGDTTEIGFREAIDTDEDGIPDAVDIDDDNDGVLDVVENQEKFNRVAGQHFWAIFTRNHDSVSDADNVTTLYLSGDPGTNVTIDGAAGVIPANGLYELEVHKVAQPGGVRQNDAIEITADAPIVAVAEVYYIYSSEAWVLIPTVSLGTAYTSVGYPTSYGQYAGFNAELAVVATQDGTIATVDGVAYAMDEGESLLYDAGNRDLTGAAVTSNKPVAVVSGRRCLNTGVGACDQVGEMLFPDQSLADEYYIPTLPQQFTSRIVASENNTEVRVNGSLVTTLNKGSYYQVSGSGVIVTTSQPSTAYMIAFGQSDGNGDPVFVLLPGKQNAVPDATFSAPQPLYQNYVIVSMATADTGSLLLNGAPTAASWTTFTADPTISYATIAIPQGVYSLSADTALIPIIYGETSYGSYGYVAGFGNALLGGGVLGDGDGPDPEDIDGDGVRNSLDLDSDNDGISDIYETGQEVPIVDSNRDGELDDMDVANPNDANANGLSDAVELREGGDINSAVGVTPPDFDGDFAEDYHDLDSDADGIPDVVEWQPTVGYEAPIDAGAPGIEDDDTDGDGVNDRWDQSSGHGANFGIPQNSDLSDSVDFLDEDADNDTSADVIESGITLGGQDANFDGIDDLVNASPSDPDGSIDDPETDLDNEFGDTTEVGYRESSDFDNDGVLDANDFDADNDGILDVIEGGLGDVDGDDDGVLNYLDADSDNDGISDLIESGADPAFDADLDGRYDGPVDAAGIPVDANGGVTPLDSDLDDVPDYLDWDADADTIPDAIEAQLTGSYDDPTHVNNIANNGINDGGLVVPVDTDNDDIDDRLDLDSDLDEILDIVEADGGAFASETNVDGGIDPSGPSGLPTTGAEFDYRVPLDSDSDGEPDYLDDDDDNDGITDVVECSVNDAIALVLDASATAYAAAADGEWVSVTKAEYDAIAGEIPNTERVGTPETSMLTGPVGQPQTQVFTWGQNMNPSSAGVYVIGFKRAAQQAVTGDNDVVRLASTTDGTGWNQYGGTLPSGTVENDQEHWVFKTPTLLQVDAVYVGMSTDDHTDVYYQADNTHQWQSPGSVDTLPTLNEVDGVSYQALATLSLPSGTGGGCPDNDGDGVPNRLDLDSDNDGISDLYESGQDQALRDADNDGRHDNLSVDGNGVPVDAAGGVTPVDTDLDTVDDFVDLDADDDRIPDAVEAQATGSYTTATFVNNADNHGINDNGLFLPVNSDTYLPDATVDYLDDDSDNDTISDADESGTLPTTDANGDGVDDAVNASYADPDGDINNPSTDLPNEVGDTSEIASREFADGDSDAIPDTIDKDDDNDGIVDTFDGANDTDTDSDGIPDRLDLDSDNDGISDLIEAGIDRAVFDTNDDGEVDDVDDDADSGNNNDANGNGISDSIETFFGGNPASGAGADPVDSDLDLVDDMIDLDSDDDFIPDAVEAQTTAGYTEATFANNATNRGVNDNGLFVPVNSDTYQPDATVDYLDTDSDNDMLTDAAESGVTASVDADNDGIDDAVNASYADPAGDIDDPNTDLPNEVGDTSEVAYREFADGDTDLIPDTIDQDDDNDGITDVTEGGDSLDTDNDSVPNRLDLDSDNDGISDLYESGQDQTTVDLGNDGRHDGGISAGGIPTAVGAGHTPVNSDTDGVVDFLDLDSDNDRIPDAIEAQATISYSTATFTNNDVAWGVNDNGLFVPVNSDSYLPDATVDYLDEDSDNDTLTDAAESGVTASVDADNDGIDDAVNASYADPAGDINDPNIDLPNEVGNANEVAYREFTDSDGDLIPDTIDQDDDNDGMTDIEEGGNTLDTDNDSVPNRLDLDSDNDGISDLYESGQDHTVVDTGNDGRHDGGVSTSGIPTAVGAGHAAIDTDLDNVDDHLDLDSDTDLIPDAIEARATSDYVNPTFLDNADSAGVNDNGLFVPVNSDTYLPDATVDYLDDDSDNDSVTDLLESGITPSTDSDGDGIDDAVNASYADPGGDINDPNTDLPNEIGGTGEVAFREIDDTDGDGLPSPIDLDDDNDGLLDTSEGGGLVDTDTDGVDDSKDLDSDNDGISDLYESGQDQATIDPGNDGVVDGGVDGTGVPSAVPGGATPIDSDTDLVFDHLDLDSDNDLIPDAIEAQDTATYVTATFVNNADNAGVNDNGLFVPVNSDTYLPDATVDYLDDDSDNDSKSDLAESGITPSIDADGDGIDDAVNASYSDPAGDINDPNIDLPNEVGNLTEVAYREFLDSDSDSVPEDIDLDDDNDGITDADEGGTTLDTDSDLVPNRLDLDSDNDGISDLIESGLDQATFDTDNDGIADSGVDGDGVPTSASGGTTPLDHDADLIDSFVDLDSDGDLIPDAIEARSTMGYVPPTFNDNASNSGVNDNGLFVPENSDYYNPDTTPDFLDTDSDNDLIPDADESGITPDLADLDLDGIDDAVNASYADPGGDIDDPNTDLPNEVGNTDQVAYREFTDSDLDSHPDTWDEDDDNDGITDDDDGANNIDTDGDGVADRIDLDSDNDGVSDLIEAGIDHTVFDVDNDGEVDDVDDADPANNNDANDNGISDSIETQFGGNPSSGVGATPGDFDTDLIVDMLDLDSDNDLIPDVVEARDTAGFVSPTYANNESNSGVNDNGLFIPVESSVDADADIDMLDADTDGDGAPDADESGKTASLLDVDNNGADDVTLATYADPLGDVDDPEADLPNEFGDTTEVAYRERGDEDLDGIFNAVDVDADNDGITNSVEGFDDTDGDGVPDRIDLDSDNDGISDLIESGQDESVVDLDNNGVHDGGVNGQGLPIAAGVGFVPADPDGDTFMNTIDLDSDGDTIPDAIEAQPTSGYSNPTHSNNSLNRGVNNNGLFVPIDTDLDLTPDYLDLNSDDDNHTDELEADGGVTPTYVNVDGSINPFLLAGLPDDGTEFNFRVVNVICVESRGTVASWFHTTNLFGPNANTDTPAQDGRILEFPIDDLANDYEFWDGGGIGADAQTVLAQGVDEVIGAGLSNAANSYNGVDNLLYVEGVDKNSLGAAIADDDYVEYAFTTAAAMDQTFIEGLSYLDHPVAWPDDYRRAVLVSDDNFATSTTLIQNEDAVQGLDVLPDAYPITDTNFELQPNTTYQFRVYLYRAAGDAVTLDDFGVRVAVCN